MKHLFLMLTISALSFTLNLPKTSNDESFLSDSLFKKKITIANSVIKIKTQTYIATGHGSGILMKINKKTYALTNAHVCLGSELDNAINSKKIANMISYEITNNKNKIKTRIDTNHLVYDTAQDWCLIPISFNLKYPITDPSFLSNNYEPEMYYLTYNRQKDKTVKFDKIQGCSSESNDLFPVKNCDQNPQSHYQNRMSYIVSKTKEQKVLKLQESLSFYWHTIPGDSGSPVFNKQYQLTGLVVATGIKINNYPILHQRETGSLTTMMNFKIIATETLNEEVFPWKEIVSF